MAPRRPAPRAKAKNGPARWRVVRIKGTPASDMGVFEAETREEAVEKACATYGINDPYVRRLMAQRVG